MPDAWPYLGAEAEHVEDATRHVEASGVVADAADVGAAPALRPIWGCWGRAPCYSAVHHGHQIHCSFGANIAATAGRSC